MASGHPHDLTVMDASALGQIVKKPDEHAYQRAQGLLRQAADFAAVSVGAVVSDLQEDPRCPRRLYHNYTRLALGLEVHFLFPNLNLSERKLLARLMEAHNALVLRRQALQVGYSRPARPERKAPVGECVRKLKQLRARARGLRHAPRLTLVQRAVLEEILGNRPL
jgi:hypothetical protein